MVRRSAPSSRDASQNSDEACEGEHLPGCQLAGRLAGTYAKRFRIDRMIGAMVVVAWREL
jgi:hypothetical protein